MVRLFQLARKTISVTLEEITEPEPIEIDRGSPLSQVTSYNHVFEMKKAFCDPPPVGWRLVEKIDHFNWTWTMTRRTIETTGYVFERDD
jgi:hypothetical protein